MVKHILIECVDFSNVRQRFYRVPSLQDLFKTVKPEVILEFLTDDRPITWGNSPLTDDASLKVSSCSGTRRPSSD